MTGRELVYAGDPVRVVGELYRSRAGFAWTACVPDPWDGDAGPRMGYADDAPVRFRRGLCVSWADAVNAVTSAAVGAVGADANVCVIREDGAA